MATQYGSFLMLGILRMILLVCACLLPWQGARAQAYARFVNAEKATSIVVISEDATPGEMLAAEVFRGHVEKMTGVRLPLWRDSSLESVDRMLVVSIGRTNWLSNADRKALGLGDSSEPGKGVGEGYLIHRAPRYVCLAGRDDLGTLYAVCDMLARLGCEFSGEGEARTKVTKQQYLHYTTPLAGVIQPKPEFKASLTWLEQKLGPAQKAPLPMPRQEPRGFVVKDSKPAATIVLAQYPTDKEIFAGGELQAYIKRMTGAELPVVRTGGAQPAADHLLISIGKTPWLAGDIARELRHGEMISATDKANDAVAVVKTPGVLMLAGHRDQGTVFAVYEFLEGLGCRWYFANDAGTIIPQGLVNIQVPDKKTIRMPDFAIRKVYAWWAQFREEDDWHAEAHWHQANRLSEGDPRGVGSHNFDQILALSLYRQHPEYFSMVRGARHNPKEVTDWQMCLSNPEVVNLSVAWAQSRWQDFEPSNEVASYAFNDGYGQCECPDCKALGNNADAFLHFANQVGKRLLAERPDALIGIWAYAPNSVVPTRVKAHGYDQNQDRVLVRIYENSALTPWRELIQGYGKASHRLYVHKIWHIAGYDAGGTRPVNHKDTLEEFPFYKRNNVVGVGLQALSHWASNGLDRYLVSRLMWDADADVQAITDEFCRKMFPNAAGEFADYLKLYDLKGKYERRPYGDYKPHLLPERPGEITPQQWVSRGLAQLELIRAKIKTPEELKRWQFYVLYMHQQSLEFAIEASDGDLEREALYIDMIALLKGTQRIRVLESNIAIGKGFGGAMRQIGYPGRSLSFQEIPPMVITDEAVTAMFKRDRAKHNTP